MKAYRFALILALLPAPPALAGDEPVSPVPSASGLDSGKVELGALIYHDISLSDSGRIACASCHDLNRGGADWNRLSRDSRGDKRQRNTPTTFNTSLNYYLHWDGRFSDLESEALDGITSARSLNTPLANFLQALREHPHYSKRFAELYADGITRDNLADALATFERSLVTPDSAFDRYLRGDKDALSGDALDGYRLFKQYGCISCHQGVNLGGNLFAKIGIATPIPADSLAARDPGRFNVTGRRRDKHVFRVPSLRNVAVTPPYLHNGSIATLDETIRLMGLFQLGRKIPATDRKKITAFLHGLTGKYRGKRLQAPPQASTKPTTRSRPGLAPEVK